MYRGVLPVLEWRIKMPEVYECLCGCQDAWVILSETIQCQDCGKQYKLGSTLPPPDSFNAQKKHYLLKEKESD